MSRYVLVTLIILGIPIPASAEPGFAASKTCRACHNDIFELWKHSLHAQSFSDPPFQAAYMQLMLEEGRDSTRMCLSCHAPAAYLSGGDEANTSLATEGVSCSFCHAVSSVNAGNAGSLETYYNLDTSGVAYGPYPPADWGHEVRFSELHRRSELCAGCHEFANANGVMLLETYSEWKASEYPQNEVHCQNCHMPIMYDLQIVDHGNDPSRFVTAHEFRGGHSRINLEHAVALETSVTRTGSALSVEVTVTNSESGHKLPTGIPIRKLVLTVAMRTPQGAEIASGRKVYRKVLCDKYGAVIENVADMFAAATRVYADNRIAPKESRIERFNFEIPERTPRYIIEAVLNYEYNRPVLTEESVSIQMAKNTVDSRTVE